MAEKQTRNFKKKAENSQNSAPEWLKILLEQQQAERRQQREEDLERRREENERKQQEDELRREEINTLRELIISIANPQQGRSEVAVQSNHSENTKTKLPSPARPSILDADISYSKFIAWRESWLDYAMLQKLDQLPLNVQKADFRSCLSEDMRQHLKCAIEIEVDNEDVSLKDILDKIQQHLRLKRNVAIDRVAFENLRQDEHQSFDEFYVSLRKLASESDLCQECVNSRLVTKIMAGVYSQEVKH